MKKIFLIVTMFISACTTDQIELGGAIKACETHEGIYEISNDLFGNGVFGRCKDNYYFELSGKGEERK